MSALRAIGLGAALGLATASPSHGQDFIDLYGVTQATLEWSPASGSTSGYYVIVSRNGGTPALQGVSQGTRTTVQSSFGETLSVQVAAFDTAGVAGPLSPPSSTLRFNAPPSSTTTDPAPAPAPAPQPGSTDPAPSDPAAGGTTQGDLPVAASARFDFSGDGISDLLLRDPRTEALTLWDMQGTQVTGRAALPQLASPWYVETAADYDGDGGADLLWRNSRTGQLIVWLVHGGTVAASAGLELGSITRDWKIAAHGDFDGDGRVDIVLARPKRGVVDILYMDGARVATRDSRKAPSDRWRVIAAPDADGDGAAEIVWENVDSHALAIEWMSAPGRTLPLVSNPGGWRVLGSGDLDGDGRADLLVRERGTRRVQGWLLDGSRATQSAWSATPADRYWTYRGLGDFDGDGRADSFWYHPGGAIEIWRTGPGGIENGFASENAGDDTVVGDGGN